MIGQIALYISLFLLYYMVKGEGAMDTNSKYTLIETDEDYRETVSHGSSKYPFAFYDEDVWEFDFHCIDWHWHAELEFVYVKSGTMTAMVGSERFRVGPNTGLFINTKVLHRFDSESSVIIPNILFLPTLFAAEDSLLYQNYISPVLYASAPYQIFSDDVPWQAKINRLLLDVFALQQDEEKNEWRTVQHLMELWDILYRHTKVSVATFGNEPSAAKQAQLQIMMRYIQDHYQNPISLDEISSVAAISKSSAMKLFAMVLHTSPIAFLVRYRLQCAAQLLLSTEQTVGTIAQNTGFSDTAYFCRKFKKLYGMTPTQYRAGGDHRGRSSIL